MEARQRAHPRTDARRHRQRSAPNAGSGGAKPEPPAHRAAESTARAVIGASLDLQGELSGEEDLLIEGRVQGRIQFPQHAVTIGAKGRVSAGVLARLITIEGEVDGNLVAEEMLVLKKSARVRGDLVAPRVVIEDGAALQGHHRHGTGGEAGAGSRSAPVGDLGRTDAGRDDRNDISDLAGDGRHGRRQQG